MKTCRCDYCLNNEMAGDGTFFCDKGHPLIKGWKKCKDYDVIVKFTESDRMEGVR